MYDRPETRRANERFWTAIRRHLAAEHITAPLFLDHETPLNTAWESPDLLFSQTCGRPFRLRLHGKVQLVGTPDYRLEGCPPGYYRSALVVRARDDRTDLAEFQSSIFAYNEEMSQSGWAAPVTHAAERGLIFGKKIATGGHRLSAQAVAEGRADFAAIDAMTWELIKRYDGFSLDLRVLEWTTPTPGLPYITGPNQNAAGIARAVTAALSDLDLDDLRTLRIRDLVSIPAADYLAVPNP